MQATFYHVVLRTSALTLALVLLFQSGLLSPVTTELSHNAGDYVAQAIGVNAVVAPTELSTITAELTKQRTELDAREAALVEREIAVNLNTGDAADERMTFILSAVLFVLLVLIVLNYVLDYLRSTRRRTVPAN